MSSLERLVGFPYTGRFGCFVLVREALQRLGKDVPDYTQGLTDEHVLSELQERLRQHAVEVEKPERGDLVLLRIMGNPHIGIMVSPTEMLHCTETVNACIERIESAKWRGRVVGFWRL